MVHPGAMVMMAGHIGSLRHDGGGHCQSGRVIILIPLAQLVAIPVLTTRPVQLAEALITVIQVL